MLCETPRARKDVAKFARRLNHAQRRAPGFRPNRRRKYPAPRQDLITMDGKEPNHGAGVAIRSAMADTNTNEIPVARKLFERLDRAGRRVSLDSSPHKDLCRVRNPTPPGPGRVPPPRRQPLFPFAKPPAQTQTPNHDGLPCHHGQGQSCQNPQICDLQALKTLKTLSCIRAGSKQGLKN